MESKKTKKTPSRWRTAILAAILAVVFSRIGLYTPYGRAGDMCWKADDSTLYDTLCALAVSEKE